MGWMLRLVERGPTAGRSVDVLEISRPNDLGDITSAAAASAISSPLDLTFTRGCHDGERHLEVRVGNVETSAGARQVFGAVARTDTDIAVLIRRNLEMVGGTSDTELIPGLRILPRLGRNPPILDWFGNLAGTSGERSPLSCSRAPEREPVLPRLGARGEERLSANPHHQATANARRPPARSSRAPRRIAMRLQHTKQAASGLSTDEPGRMQAKSVIVAEVERLRWRSIDRIRKFMHVFKGERGHRTTGAPSRKLWRALHEVDNYLNRQSDWLVNYAKRYRTGSRVGTRLPKGLRTSSSTGE